eukprot:3361509-Prymnesium_polylepis.1
MGREVQQPAREESAAMAVAKQRRHEKGATARSCSAPVRPHGHGSACVWCSLHLNRTSTSSLNLP